MRVYGMNVVEVCLATFAKVAGWLLVLLAATALLFTGLFDVGGPRSALLVGVTGMTGLLLLLGSAGLRQNRPALDLGLRFLTLVALGWIARGAMHWHVAVLVVGVVLALLWIVAAVMRREAVKARFKPRFFTPRQFETMVQVADVLIEGDGREALHPIEVAVRIDHFLARISSPALADLRMALFLVEWVTPLLLGWPLCFSALGTFERRKVVDRVIGMRGPFRDLARALKSLACIGYYGSPEGMASVGFIDFDRRARSHVDQAPKHYPPPLKATRP